MSSNRNITRALQYIAGTRAILPEPKEVNDDADDMVNDAIRETLDEVEHELTRPPKSLAEVAITGTGFRTTGIYRIFYERIRSNVRARREEYDAEVHDWYENGDGRDSKDGGAGHRFPECIHGRSLWVDYDIPCADCESGETDTEVAQGFARDQFLRFNDRWDWLRDAPGDLPQDDRKRLTEWVLDVFPKTTRRNA